MKRLSTQDLCAGGGRLFAGAHRAIDEVSIDTRTLTAGATFFCVRGPRFDGHRFADAAVEAGATVIVADQAGCATLSETVRQRATVVQVSDTVLALGALAAVHRGRFEGVVVGVTGSSGKTTTKEMVATVLEVLGPTLRTRGNLNNHLGVPLTLLRLRAEHRYAVVEMGMSAPGEIATLAAMARPRVGVITTVGAAHLEGLGSLEAVAKAKGELFDALPPEGLAVVLSNVVFASVLTRGLSARCMRVGIRLDDELVLSQIDERAGRVAGTVTIAGRVHRLSLPMVGRHNLDDALLALAVGCALGVPPEAAVEALSKVTPPAMRGEVRHLIDGTPVVLDCYNANPQSMAASVRAFHAGAPDGVLVLGDMLELGAAEETAHAALGQAVAQLSGAPILVGVGSLTAGAVDAARAAGMPESRAVAVSNAAAAAAYLMNVHQPGRPVLLKGSRGMRLEQVFEALDAIEERN